MGSSYVIFLMALMLVHATARDVPNDDTKPSMAIAPAEIKETTVAEAPAANGVGDEKNFITYGGIGGWAGVGYVGGVIPVLPVLGGVGGVGAAGGAGAAGKVIP